MPLRIGRRRGGGIGRDPTLPAGWTVVIATRPELRRTRFDPVLVELGTTGGAHRDHHQRLLIAELEQHLDPLRTPGLYPNGPAGGGLGVAAGQGDLRPPAVDP
jgi:hypothetical protein